MTFQDRDPRDPPYQPADERLQVDPMLRRGNRPWGWGLVIAAGLVVAAVLFFATSRDTNQVAVTPGASPPASTTGAGPTPPETTPNSARGDANVPPASPNARPAPAPQSAPAPKQ
jgi:hypothetical protein